MSRLFRDDSPIMIFLSELGDHMMLNVLFVICSLPVVTVGSSLTASFRVARLLADKSCDHVVPQFFRAFRENFKQSTLLWCTALLAYAVLVLYYGMSANDTLPYMKVWLAGAFCICFLLTAVLCYAFPLISRYENSLLQHIRNAAILTVTNLPRTLLLMLISIFPVLMFVFMPGIFFYILPLWVVLLFSMLTRACVGLIRPLFRSIEGEPEEKKSKKTKSRVR